jgi:pre-rRNA-processing protein TSR3
MLAVSGGGRGSMAEPEQDPPAEQEGSPRKPFTVKLHVLHLDQDDPKKCTAKKLKRFGLVQLHPTLRTVPIHSIKLDPYAETVLSAADRENILRSGLTVIDCSWNETTAGMFKRMRLKNGRRLGVDFLAANPINYAMPGKLSSVEALAASLIITGFFDEAEFLLSKFGWGHTFLELNGPLIAEIKANFGDVSTKDAPSS